MVKNYVKFTDEIDNEFISNLNKLDERLQILTIENGETKVKPISRGGYWPSRFKYVKNIYDINHVLTPEETLVIEIGIDDLDKINQNNLFQIRFPEMEQQTRIGGKCYLVDYDFSFKGLPKEIERSFDPVVALKDIEQNQEFETYQIKQVHTITSNIDERRQDLKVGYGGITDLYYRTSNPMIASQFEDSIIEFTQIAPGKWTPTKIPSYMMDEYSK